MFLFPTSLFEGAQIMRPVFEFINIPVGFVVKEYVKLSFPETTLLSSSSATTWYEYGESSVEFKIGVLVMLGASFTFVTFMKSCKTAEVLAPSLAVRLQYEFPNQSFQSL